MAEQNGGYPMGYIKMANREKLTAGGISPDEFLCRGDMAYLLEKAIRADYLEGTVYTNDGYTDYERQKGILRRTQNIYSGLGKVEGTDTTLLTLSDSHLGTLEVMIDNEVYNAGNTNAYSMLGFDVEYWYEIKNDQRVLCAIIPDINTDIITLSTAKDDIIEISDKEITFVREGEIKEETIKSDSETAITYNGVAIEESVTKTLDSVSDYKGFITIVQNGDKSKTIAFEEYIDLKVESLNTAEGVVKFSQYPTELNIDGKKNNVIITRSNGNVGKISDIEIGEIITAYISKNTGKKVIRIFKNDNSISGKITSYDGEYYYINNERYVFSNQYKDSKEIGIEKTYGINIYGNIIDAKPISGVPQVGLYFGYAAISKVFSGTINIKIMDTSGKVNIYPLAEKVIIDGNKMTDFSQIEEGYDTWIGLDEIEKETTPVRYKLNTKNEVSMIDFPCSISEVEEGAVANENNRLLKMCGTEKNFRYSKQILSSSGSLEYYCPKTAYGFNFYSTENREEDCAVGLIDTVFTVPELQINGGVYSLSGNENVADIIINDGTSIRSNIDAPIIFEGFSTKLDADGEVVNVLNGISATEEKEYIIDDIAMNDETLSGQISNLEKGDIIRVNVITGNRVRQITPLMLEDELNDRLSPKLHEGNHADGSVDLKSAYIYGTIVEKSAEYIVVDTTNVVSSDKTPLKDKEVIAFSGVTGVDFYRSKDGEREVIKNNQTDKITSVGNKVFVYISEGKATSFIVFSK